MFLINLLFLLGLQLAKESGLFLFVLLLGVGLKSSIGSVVWIGIDLLMSLKVYSLMKPGMLEGLFLTISSTRGRMTGLTWDSMYYLISLRFDSSIKNI